MEMASASDSIVLPSVFHRYDGPVMDAVAWVMLLPQARWLSSMIELTTGLVYLCTFLLIVALVQGRDHWRDGHLDLAGAVFGTACAHLLSLALHLELVAAKGGYDAIRLWDFPRAALCLIFGGVYLLALGIALRNALWWLLPITWKMALQTISLWIFDEEEPATSKAPVRLRLRYRRRARVRHRIERPNVLGVEAMQ